MVWCQIPGNADCSDRLSCEKKVEEIPGAAYQTADIRWRHGTLLRSCILFIGYQQIMEASWNGVLSALLRLLIGEVQGSSGMMKSEEIKGAVGSLFKTTRNQSNIYTTRLHSLRLAHTR